MCAIAERDKTALMQAVRKQMNIETDEHLRSFLELLESALAGQPQPEPLLVGIVPPRDFVTHVGSAVVFRAVIHDIDDDGNIIWRAVEMNNLPQ